MSWSKLQTALQQMKDTGEDGFEGLVALLLSLVCEQTFVLARSGFQPGGDSTNLPGTISLQAKRYKPRDPPVTKVVGDLHVALHALPNLDTYVVAVTRNTTQLQAALEREAHSTGVDILCLGLGGVPPDLGVLCASFWHTIEQQCRALSRRLTPTTKRWLTRQGRSPAVKCRLDSLRRELAEHTTTFHRLRGRWHSRLQATFSKELSSITRGGRGLDLDHAVPREAIARSLSAWWNGRPRAAFLEGEEGCGKTSAAGLFVRTLLDDNSTLCLWFNSVDWATCDGLQSVLTTALSRHEPDTRRHERLFQCLLRPRTDRILLVLDGVNERGMTGAANVRTILDDLIFHTDGYRHVRILLTTRPLHKRPGVDTDQLWKQCERIPVGRFDDHELCVALDSLEAGLRPRDLTEPVRALAHIPRYCQLCVQLRHRLGGMAHVTPELVLWMALLQRLEQHDHQVTTSLNWQTENDAAAVLRAMARSVAGNDLHVGAKHLEACFQRPFLDIRRDLEELRMARETTPNHASLEPDHIVLGWALELLYVLRLFHSPSVLDTADRITHALEPWASDDLRTKALFVAFHLSRLYPDQLGPHPDSKRAALLLTWVQAPNSEVEPYHLDTIAQVDVSAYTGFVEAFYTDLQPGDAQQLVIEPLARIWQRGAPDCARMRDVLRRWLLLTRPLDASGDVSTVEHHGHVLPVATTPEQLRLTSVALSILSLRPDPTLLETVALCAATESLSKATQQGHPVSLKSLSKNLGLLMRWSYTEQCVPVLVKVARSNSGDDIVKKGLRILASHLALVDVPSELSSPPREPLPWNTVSCAEILGRGELLFTRPPDAPHVSFHELPYLAVRNDMPGLAESDRRELFARMRELVEKHKIHSSRGQTPENHSFDELLPWLAREDPRLLSRLVDRLRLRALSYDRPEFLLHSIEGTCGTPGSDESRELLTDLLDPRRSSGGWGSERHALILELAPPQQLPEWLQLSANDQVLRDDVCTIPIPWLLASRVEPPPPPATNGDPDILTFWCDILGWTTKENASLYHWARDLLILRDWPERTRRGLLAVVATAGGAKWFASVWSDSALLVKLTRADFWTLDRAARHQLSAGALESPFDSYIRALPQDLAGLLFLDNGDTDKLSRWGSELLDIMEAVLREPSPATGHRGRTVVLTDENGRIVAVTNESSPGAKDIGGTSTASWGTDYGTLKEFQQTLATQEQPSDSPDTVAWKADVDRLREWIHFDLWHFAGEEAIRAWASAHPDDFVSRAKSILSKTKHCSARHFHAGPVLEILLRLLLPSDPINAFDTYRDLIVKRLRLNRHTYYGASALLHDLWNVALCPTREHDDLRRRAFLESRNDLDLQRATLAALAHGEGDRIWRVLLEGQLRHARARDRAIAVSILRWVADERAVRTLDHLASHDLSRWVRQFAMRSAEIARAEHSCKLVYGEVLRESDPVHASALLQLMKPALTGTAEWWRRSLEREADASGGPRAPDVKALSIRFWAAWGRVTSHKTAHGRDLTRSFCGEELDPFVAPRMAPFWEPGDST